MRLAFGIVVLGVFGCLPWFCNSANAQLFAENVNRLGDGIIWNVQCPNRCQPAGPLAHTNRPFELPAIDRMLHDAARNQEEFGRRFSERTGLPTLRELFPGLATGPRDRFPSGCPPRQPTNVNTTPPAQVSEYDGHPLSPAIELAQQGLAQIQEQIFDYTATLVKRVRINGSLQPTEYVTLKIRHAREVNGEKIPFSVYMRFLKPADKHGQEVIWVNGRNQNKLLAHGNPKSSLGRIMWRLDPDSTMAMIGNRYPIYDAGIENLVIKIIEKASRDRAAGGDCTVNFSEEAKINQRPCSVIELLHPKKMEPYDFHKAKVYIDKELELPVRYVSWDWPSKPGEKPRLLEEFTYVNLKLNVGLTDEDFDYRNPEYDYR